MKNLIIDSFTLDFDKYLIEVFAMIDGKEIDCIISRSLFEEFIDDHDLREWCRDYYDPSEPDGHGQQEGKLTWKEYWDQYSGIIKGDIHEFLMQSIRAQAISKSVKAIYA